MLTRIFEKLYQTYLTDCFGAAASDIRRMYDRWSKNFVEAIEPSLALYDLDRASAKVSDPAIQGRINELKAYVQYLKLYEAHLEQNTAASYETLVNFTLSIHHLRLVHTHALVNLYLPLPKGYQREKDKNKLQKKYSTIKPLQPSEINSEFARSLRTAIPEVKSSIFTPELTALVHIGNPKPVVAQFINSQNRYDFFCPEQKTFVVKAGSTKATNIYVLNERNDTVF
ncbi:MAG: hypothetical protein NVV59_19865 [Chitinophagaceae bacterium]|nr:hypothetical protein [Chitinophagaceae bacterium]